MATLSFGTFLTKSERMTAWSVWYHSRRTVGLAPALEAAGAAEAGTVTLCSDCFCAAATGTAATGAAVAADKGFGALASISAAHLRTHILTMRSSGITSSAFFNGTVAFSGSPNPKSAILL